MLFTHYMPGHHPLFADLTWTMQIFSIKITELDVKEFKWPLEVYGVVAVRDAVDYRRNVLFLRTRDNCQFLTEKVRVGIFLFFFLLLPALLLKDIGGWCCLQDSCLHLTGPSRAIMSADKIHIEIQLKVKGTMKSKDRSLMTKAFACSDGANDADRKSVV